MSKVLHIKDAYFKIPNKCKDDFGCAITLLGVVLQRSGLTLEEANEIYRNSRVSDFLDDDKQECLLSCDIINEGMNLIRVQSEVPRYTKERC